MQKRTWTRRMARVAAAAGATAVVVAGGATTSPAGAQPAPADAVAKNGHVVMGKSCRMAAGRTASGATRRDADSLTPAQVRAQEHRLRSAARAQGYSAALAPKPVVPVIFHVIDNTAGDSPVTEQQLDDQITVLNQAYGGKASAQDVNTGIKFKLKDTDYVVNDDWYDWAYPRTDPTDDDEAKTALHRGGLKTLNVYVANLGDNLLGYATFPDPSDVVHDGVVILNASLPGGSAVPYDGGDTLTHEAGHWFNLYHTFQGGCSKRNDRVKDTPAQDDGDNIFSCDESLNTCKQAGRDPVHNYMSYGDDPCLDRFTKGQAARMIKAYTVLRS